MGEAKQKAIHANDQKIIEASEVERWCLVQFFGRQAVPENRIDQRRYSRLFDDFDLDTAEETGVRKSSEDPKGFDFARDLSGDLMEYSTTLDVIEYVSKATDTKIPGLWVRPILRVAERMLACKEGTYKAPSLLAAEEPAPATDSEK